ncbi:MAG: prephenate dehydratase [Thermodesulfobacteriota bacterium]
MNDSGSEKPGGPENRTLEQLRQEISRTDREILTFLNRRAELCLAVGRIKAATDDAIFKPFREKEVLQQLVGSNPGALPEDHLRAIYREILSSSRKLQRPDKVVYLGPEGTFSYFAGVELLGGSTDFEPRGSLADVFAAVAAREAALGVVPLENSLHGSVGQNLDFFLRYPVFIQAEIYCRVSHCLLSAGDGLEAVQTVYSHPRALEQCAAWLDAHLPRAECVPVSSTAAAARRAAGRREYAAIGHSRLADMFSLKILAARIEDMPDNWTRFVTIGPDMPAVSGRDKTSLLFTLPDRSGALSDVLSVLARGNINMKKLESRPLKTDQWQYLFFADVECDLNDDEYSGLMRELSGKCHSLKILGSYPAGRNVDEGCARP